MIKKESLTVPAEVEAMDTVHEFVERNLEECGCPQKAMFQVRLALEELFVNIASYAYQPGKGEAEVRFEALENPQRAAITLVDSGKYFDPLAKEDADTSEEALLNRVGGLGILLVKNTMDDVRYRYENGQNITTIVKNL